MLIIRLDAIGDALALTPLLAALRDRSIPADVVLRPENAGIFARRAIREPIVSTFDLRSDERSNLAAIAQLGAQLSQRNYTHVLVATEDPGGYRLARATRAPVRIGFSNGWGKPLKSLWSRAFLTRSIYRSARLDRRARHECAVLFDLGRPLLGEAAPTRDVAQLRPLVLDAEPERSDTRVAVQITDKWERLGFALSDVVESIQRLANVATLRLIAADSERDYADAIARATDTEVERFRSLAPWKLAIAAARAVVTPDSGALHVAGTIGTPVVGIFAVQRDIALQTARWAPWAAPSQIIIGKPGWPLAASDALQRLLQDRSRSPIDKL